MGKMESEIKEEEEEKKIHTETYTHNKYERCIKWYQ